MNRQQTKTCVEAVAIKDKGANAATLARAIRAKCLECSGGMRREVQDCRLQYCPLWPYRLGIGDIIGERRVRTERSAALYGISGQMDINDFVGGNFIGECQAE